MNTRRIVTSEDAIMSMPSLHSCELKDLMRSIVTARAAPPNME